MHVNQLAQESGVAAHVVRYYTQVGLLKPKRDPNNRYRNYAGSDIYRVRFIRRAKWLGFTLSDVRAILRDADRGVSPCSHVREILKSRASETRKRAAQLESLLSRVEAAVILWESMPDRPPSHASLCHLIDTVAGADGP